MASYGTLLDEGVDIEYMYKTFVDYFNDPVLTKIGNVSPGDGPGFSKYMTKCYCLLSKECRYIVAFVDQDNNEVHTTKRLSELWWKSLQTRELADYHNLQPHSYNPENKGPLTCAINRTEKNTEASTYVCSAFPIVVTLLHTKKKGIHDYQDRGTVIAALETWQTIVTLKV